MRIYKEIKKGLKKEHWIVKLAILVLLAYLFLALFAPYIANDRPFRAILLDESQTIKPISLSEVEANRTSNNESWATLEYEQVTWCWIPFSPQVELENAQYLSPLSSANHPTKTKHWLGTTSNSKDLTSVLIHGTRTALILGLLTMLIAALLGTYWGILGGLNQMPFYHFNLLQIIVSGFILLLLNFEIQQLLKLAVFEGRVFFFALLGMVILGLMWYLLGKLPLRKFKIKKDDLVLLGIEVVHTLPGLLFIMMVNRWNKGGLSILQFSMVVGLLIWPIFARFARTETQQLVAQNFVQSAYALGQSRFGVLRKHIVPNILMRIALPFVLGFGGVILLEASLSFLGYGLSDEVTTWGRTMQIGSPNNKNWHIILFPGLCIMGVVLPLAILGNRLRKT